VTLTLRHSHSHIICSSPAATATADNDENYNYTSRDDDNNNEMPPKKPPAAATTAKAKNMTSGSGDVDDLAERLQGQGLGKDRPAANYSLLLREPYLIRVYLVDGIRYIKVELYVGAGTLTSEKGTINAKLTKDGTSLTIHRRSVLVLVLQQALATEFGNGIRWRQQPYVGPAQPLGRDQVGN